jgi:DNA-binding MarR family transcriptional regulator
MTSAARVDVAEEIEQALTTLLRGPRIQRLHQLLIARAGVSLDRPSYNALASLDDQGPLRMSDLADACGVDASTMSRQADRLLASALIERDSSAQDGRAVVMRLSAKGKRLVRLMKSVRRQALQELLARWDDSEQQLFAELLSRFVRDTERIQIEMES